MALQRIYRNPQWLLSLNDDKGIRTLHSSPLKRYRNRTQQIRFSQTRVNYEISRYKFKARTNIRKKAKQFLSVLKYNIRFVGHIIQIASHLSWNAFEWMNIHYSYIAHKTASTKNRNIFSGKSIRILSRRMIA